LQEFVKIAETVYEVDAVAICDEDKIKYSRVVDFKVGWSYELTFSTSRISTLIVVLLPACDSCLVLLPACDSCLVLLPACDSCLVCLR